MSVPFIGRATELDLIRSLGRTITVEHRPSALLFIGEPGLGKTRLLAEAPSASGIRNLVNVVGYEPERNVPLAAAAELLRTLMRGDPGSRLGELLSEPAQATLEPIRVFEAAHRAAERLLPLLILLDDLQWADDMTLALCHYLLRAGVSGRRPIGLIAVSRPSQVAGSFIDAMGHVFGETGRFAIQELEPFDRADGIRRPCHCAEPSRRGRGSTLDRSRGLPVLAIGARRQRRGAPGRAGHRPPTPLHRPRRGRARRPAGRRRPARHDR